MKVIPFDKQCIDDKCIDLNGPNIHTRAYPGQDSVVYHNIETDKAIHVYNNMIDFDRALLYAQCVNDAAQFLITHPFSHNVRFEELQYSIDIHVNPVEEVGEKLFTASDESIQRAYIVSPFVRGLSLCWPQQATDEEQRAVARCCGVLLYDRINDYIETQSSVACVDINPVNVKYAIDRNELKIKLTITDLAKSIDIVYPKSPDMFGTL